MRRLGERGSLLVMLHWLGGGAQTWTEVSEGLSRRGLRCAAVDLPGFGDGVDRAGYSVEAMADAVADTARKMRAGMGADASLPWLLAGHSMGGKVAAVVARRALDGEAGLEGLRGLVLVSVSPPSPEPMGETKRAESLALLGESTGSDRDDAKRAGKFVDANVGKTDLPEAVRERAIRGVLGMNRTAFRAWMEAGSKEDWSGRVGVLDVPALVFAGTEDAALGPEAQRKHTMPHVPRAELVVLEGAGHLGPLERAGELIEHVTQFAAASGLTLPVEQGAPGAWFSQLLGSERVSPKTRTVMEKRIEAAQNWNGSSQIFGPAEFRLLRALVGRVVPNAEFDVAAAVDAELAKGAGDGWRFAELPPDTEAWRRGLRSLDEAAKRAQGVEFVALLPEAQDELLGKARDGALGRGLLGALSGALHVGDGGTVYSAEAMQLWFEDVRAACARTYMADARTMDRVGFTGFADDLGFTQIELGRREEFER